MTTSPGAACRAGSIVAYGESLGSGQAVRLAAKRPVAAVVVEAPLTSTVDVARPVYFLLPLSWLITDQYNVERDIRSVRAPVLILHGEQDEVIPVEMGQRVYAPPTRRSASSCSATAATTICSTTARGRRCGTFRLRWTASGRERAAPAP